MTTPFRTGPRVCSECGASLTGNVDRCWLCHGAAEPRAEASGKPVSARERRVAQQFSLSSLLLVMTFLSVLLGVFVMQPGIGIVLLILATPAFISTCVAAVRRKQRGERLTPLAKTATFGAALGIVAMIVIVAGAVGLGTCLAAAFVGYQFETGSELRGVGSMVLVGLPLGTVVGLVVGGYITYAVIRRWWPR